MITGGRRPKIGILSLGCPRNLVDSESILAGLVQKGCQVVDINKADTALINTCAFIEEAKRESIDAILGVAELKKTGRLKRIIVYGCLAERYGDKLRKELPEVDAFVGSLAQDSSGARYALSPRHYAYLKISEGCLNNCSFCAIPGIKGGLASLDRASVLRKVRALNRQRPSEINIVGQDISAWGVDLYGRTRLPELLRSIIQEAGSAGWIRLLYLHPGRLSAELLKVIRDEPKVCKYIDLPIQHINSRILKLMRRRTSRADIVPAIERARSLVPGAAIRTSVIVGFPSETEKEFRQLLAFLQEARFERLGTFIYSQEEGTAAYALKGQLPHKVKVERFNRVMSLQQEISRQINRAFMGRSIDVLIDDLDGRNYLGRSQFDAPEVDGTVFIRSRKKIKPGDFVKAKITDTLEYDLVGEA